MLQAFKVKEGTLQHDVRLLREINWLMKQKYHDNSSTDWHALLEFRGCVLTRYILLLLPGGHSTLATCRYPGE